MGIRWNLEDLVHSFKRNHLEKLVEYLVDNNFPARLKYFFLDIQFYLMILSINFYEH